jgi:hypothetical protein
MNEDIFASVIRLNETEAFLIIEPHYGASVHEIVFRIRLYSAL